MYISLICICICTSKNPTSGFYLTDRESADGDLIGAGSVGRSWRPPRNLHAQHCLGDVSNELQCPQRMSVCTVVFYSLVIPVLYRATDKARKSVITYWKSLKTHWKYKLGVKIRISILWYALAWFRCPMQCVLIVNTCLKTKLKLWIVDVNLSVHLSTYCQNMVNIYSSVITSNSKSLPNYTKRNLDTALQNSNTIPLSIAKNYRGWKYFLKFENQHWVKN